MRQYPIWRCDVCRHMLAKSVFLAKNPGSCQRRERLQLICSGSYYPDEIQDHEDPPWSDGELAERDEFILGGINAQSR